MGYQVKEGRLKVWLRNLTNRYWHKPEEKEMLRDYLNNLGFYVLHGKNDSLEVYALKENDMNGIPELIHAIDIIDYILIGVVGIWIIYSIYAGD